MLRSFSVSNWKSYDELVEFSMVATRERRHGDRLARVGRSRILPVSAIYGANAAGKSTLVDALMALQEIIVVPRRPNAVLPVIPHLPGGANRSTFFKVEFIVAVDEVEHPSRELVLTYELEVDYRRIHREALLVRRGSQEEFLFERDGEDVVLYGALENDPRVGAHAAVIAANETLLGAAGSDRARGDRCLQAAYDWFAGQLNIIYPASQFVYLPARFDADALFAEAMNVGLTRADTGITGLALEEMKVDSLPLEADQIDRLADELAEKGGSFVIGGDAKDNAVFDLYQGKRRARRLVAVHTVSTGPDDEPEAFTLALREESDGTQRFMNLLPVLFQLREADARGVFIVDELENSMHPKLTEDFVRVFLSELGEGDRRQLIFTTHEIQLMRSDLLRRDEIWLVDKDRGRSQLTRVSDFADIGVRKDADLLSFYMSGRLGGVPRV